MTFDPIQNFMADPAIMGFAQVIALVFARVAPIVSFTPLFGGAAAPRRLRVGLSILLTVGMLPLASSQAMPAALPGFTFVALVLKEALLGFTLGFGVGVFFETIAALGALVDLSRGVTFSGLLDPLHGQQTSPLSAFTQLLIVVGFLSLGGYRLLVWALAESFVAVPVTRLVPAALATGLSASVALNAVAYLMLTTVKLAAPVLITLLLVDVALGLINRVAPQVSAYFLGQESKAWLGLLTFGVSLGLIARLLPAELANILAMLVQFSRAMQTFGT